MKVASWAIYSTWGNRRAATIPWNCREAADELLRRMNAAGEEKYYLQPVKEDTRDMASRIVLILTSKRRVRGKTTDRRTGEERAWTKVFTDVEVTALAEGKYLNEYKYVVHTYRGELRVVGYPDMDAFEEVVRKKWPLDYAKLMLRLED